MNRQPLLSVIIPAYNAAHFLPECLLSLQNQDYNHFEVILVDDGSTDDTADLVRQNYPWVQYFWQPNSGACSSPRNTGASRAGGELLAFFDADDVMEPGCLSTHVQALSACPAAGLSLVNYQNYDGKTGHRLGPTHFETCPRLIHTTGLGKTSETACIAGQRARAILCVENFSIASGTVIRKELFSTLGGYDETLRGSEDFHLVYRAARHGEVAISWKTGFQRRIHSENMSFQTTRILREKLKSRETLFVFERDPECRTALRRSVTELALAIAGCSASFSTAERLQALARSLSSDKVPNQVHVKTLAKIVLDALGIRRSPTPD